MRLDAPLSFLGSQPTSGGYFAAAADPSATYYFNKLVDEHAHPLGLLPFLQHPASISIRPNIEWSSRQGFDSKFGGTLSLAIYPWQRTGFVSSVTGTFTRDSSSLGLELGIHHYLSSTMRLEALYFQGRGRLDFRGDITSSRQDAGALGLSAAWAHEKLYTHFLVSLGRLQGQGGGLPNNGTQLSGNFDTEYFLNRRVSMGAGLGLTKSPGAVIVNGNASSFTSLGAGIGPFLNAYVSENLLLSAKYTALFVWYHGVQAALATNPAHAISLSAAVRL